MYNFIVLGHVPGTSIIITFTMWAQLALLIAAVAILMRMRFNQRVMSFTGAHIGSDLGSALKPLHN